MTTFENPYKGLNKKDCKQATRLQTYVPCEDFNFLFRSLHPGHGSVSVVMNMLLVKLIEGLKENNITDHATQRLEFERFLVEAKLTIKRKVKK
jgi:hypothetical protein